MQTFVCCDAVATPHTPPKAIYPLRLCGRIKNTAVGLVWPHSGIAFFVRVWYRIDKSRSWPPKPAFGGWAAVGSIYFSSKSSERSQFSRELWFYRYSTPYPFRFTPFGKGGAFHDALFQGTVCSVSGYGILPYPSHFNRGGGVLPPRLKYDLFNHRICIQSHPAAD